MRLIILGLTVLLRHVLFAQEPLTVAMLVPDKAIKLSPLHLLNFYPTIELSYEQKILPMITVQVEAGYVLNFPSNNEDFLHKRGVKLKLETRYYFWGRTDRKKMYYGAVEPYMNVINFDRYTSRRECFNVECSNQFTREYYYKMRYREQGVSLKAGLFRYWGSDLFIDINSGFTLRNIQYDDPLPEGGINDEFMFIEIPNEEDRVDLSPQLGIRIGYRLK